MNPIVKDPLQKKIESTPWLILAIIFFVSLVIAPIKFSLGVLLGGFISILNFYWMKRDLKGLFQNTGNSVKGRLMVKYYIRLSLTAVVLYFLIAHNTVNVIGLIIGLSVIVINIIAFTITNLSKNSFLKEVK